MTPVREVCEWRRCRGADRTPGSATAFGGVAARVQELAAVGLADLRSPAAIRRQVPATLGSRAVEAGDVVRGDPDGVAVGCRVHELAQADSVRVNARSAPALIAGPLRLR
jgi:hypothetical protein